MAVYTEVTDDALAAFLADYDIGTAVAFRGIAEGVENSNYSLRTTAGETVVPKANLRRRATSEKSLMPEGLLDSLSEREQIELLKFLTTN